MVGILSQVTTRRPCMIHTNIILQDSKWSEAKAGNIYSVWVKLPRGERSYRSYWSSTNHIYSYTGDHYMHRAYLRPRRPGERMGWINISQKKWVSGGWVLIHEFLRTSSESRWGLVYGLGFVHRCRDNKIRYMMGTYASSASARSRLRNPLETSGMRILFKSRSIRQTRSHLHPPHKRV